MTSFNESITGFLEEKGAALVGFADLQELEPDSREGLPHGISIAVALDPKVLTGISNGPTPEYHREYQAVNGRLAALGDAVTGMLTREGYRALPRHPTVGELPETLSTALPHKTVATRAGLGWIGKCALIITRAFGSAIRLTTVLTDAALTTGIPIDISRCGECTACVDTCPGNAIAGRNWQAGMPRESLYNAHACRRTAHKLSFNGFGERVSICGICIVACPWTAKYLENSGL